MDYVPPPAGSHLLPVIQAAPDGAVVGDDGRRHRLADYTRNRITLLSLVGTYCTEPTGGTLAHETGVELGERILADRRMHGRVRFVSLSFDPINDTHAAMQAYGGRHVAAGGALPWHFLTTASVRELDRRTIEALSEPPAKDLGRYEISRDPDDRRARRPLGGACYHCRGPSGVARSASPTAPPTSQPAGDPR